MRSLPSGDEDRFLGLSLQVSRIEYPFESGTIHARLAIFWGCGMDARSKDNNRLNVPRKIFGS